MTTPPNDLPAPVALLTGAGTGIGREAAQELSSRGWRLLLAGRREAPLLETGGMLSGPWHAVPTDVRSAEQCQAAVDAAARHFGRLDALINNAGFAPSQPVPKHTPDLIDEVFAINAQGPAYLMTAAWRLFERQNAEDHAKGLEPRGGRIVNISSMASVDPFSSPAPPTAKARTWASVASRSRRARSRPRCSAPSSTPTSSRPHARCPRGPSP